MMGTALVSALAGATLALAAVAVTTEPRTIEIAACAEDEVVAHDGSCVHPDTADFRQGYWFGEDE